MGSQQWPTWVDASTVKETPQCCCQEDVVLSCHPLQTSLSETNSSDVKLNGLISKLSLIVITIRTLPTWWVHWGPHHTVEASKVFIMIIGQRYSEDVFHICMHSWWKRTASLKYLPWESYTYLHSYVHAVHCWNLPNVEDRLVLVMKLSLQWEPLNWRHRRKDYPLCLCDAVEAHSWVELNWTGTDSEISSWQRPPGRNILLVSIITGCVVAHQFAIGMYTHVQYVFMLGPTAVESCGDALCDLAAGSRQCCVTWQH